MIWINLSETAGQVRLTVEDDGVGLPDSPEEPTGLGIRIMAHRAAMIGGSCTVEPAPTGGTIVVCSFPRSVIPEALDNGNPHERPAEE